MGHHAVMELIGTAFDFIGVGVLVLGFLFATVAFVRSAFGPEALTSAASAYRLHIGRGMVLGLEVLIAADVVKTVAVEATLDDLIALGLLIVVRTVLSWTLILEIEGRWPWQKGTSKSGSNGEI